MYNHAPKDYFCPHCGSVVADKKQLTRKSDIFYQDTNITGFINPQWWINTPGNVLIIPNKHYENIYDIPTELFSKIYLLVKKTSIAIKETYKCDGVSTRQHNESAGNQHIWHFHVHIFPRYLNDNLYQLHNKRRWTTPAERKPYADKLRKYIKTRLNNI
jgi:histidine triad (HIT) family protein